MEHRFQIFSRILYYVLLHVPSHFCNCLIIGLFAIFIGVVRGFLSKEVSEAVCDHFRWAVFHSNSGHRIAIRTSTWSIIISLASMFWKRWNRSRHLYFRFNQEMISASRVWIFPVMFEGNDATSILSIAGRLSSFPFAEPLLMGSHIFWPGVDEM